MVWSQYSILNIVIHGAQTPKYKIVYVNHLPEYCPVMGEGALSIFYQYVEFVLKRQILSNVWKYTKVRKVTLSLQKILGIGRNNGTQINKEGVKLLGKGFSKIPIF